MAKGHDVEEWQKDVRKGSVYRDKYGKSKNWLRNRACFRHEFPSLKGLPANVQQYNFNLIRTQGMNLIPSVYIRNPHITVTPTYKVDVGPSESMERQVKAKIFEALDNWWIKEIDLKREARRLILDHYLCGVGIMKDGYDSQYGFIPEDMDKMTGETDAQFSKKKSDEGQKIEHHANVKPGMPWSLRVMPDHIIVPFGCHGFGDAEWVDHVVYRRLEDVKADARYKNVATLEGSHTELLMQNIDMNFYRDMLGDGNWLEIHEIRNARTKEIMAFTPGWNKWIREPQEDVLQLDGLPYSAYTVIEDPEYFWATSDATVMEDQQKEMIEALTQAALHRRITLLKFLYDINKITEEELKKMLAGAIGIAIGVQGSTDNAVSVLQPHIPPDLIAWSDRIMADARVILGQGRNQMGDVEGSSRRSASEALIIQEGHSLRVGDRRDAMGDLISRVVRRANQYFSHFWTKEKIAMVVGVEGMKYWIKFSPTSIKGEYDANVNIESLVPPTSKMKRQELLQVMQIFAKSPGANMDFLMKAFLREFSWLDSMAILPPAPETMTEPMKQEDFMKKQMGLMRNPAELAGRRKTAVEGMLVPPMGG